jgi:tRNA G37 N-methylase Trm5
VSAAIRRAIRIVYDRLLRDRLPRKFGIYAGVPARHVPLLDVTDRWQDYKPGLLSALHDTIDDGDDVVLVGAGRGVSTVHACRAGAGFVVAYEAAAEMCEIARETVDIAGVSDRVDVFHTTVGPAIEIYGDASEAHRLEPAALPPSDVLVLDCEGAEASILNGLSEWPRAVIVETHPERGVPTDQSRSALDAAGYAIDAHEYHPDCEHDDKCVLVGCRAGAAQRGEAA